MSMSMSMSPSSGPLGIPSPAGGSSPAGPAASTEATMTKAQARSTPRGAPPMSRPAPAPASGRATTLPLPVCLPRAPPSSCGTHEPRMTGRRRLRPTGPRPPRRAWPGHDSSNLRAGRIIAVTPTLRAGDPKRRDHPRRIPENPAFRSTPASCSYPVSDLRRSPQHRLRPATSMSSSLTNPSPVSVVPGVRPRGLHSEEAATHGREPGRCGTTCGRP